MRVVACDWSGAAGRPAARKIWRCDVVDGQVAHLANGRSREEMAADLAALVRDARQAAPPGPLAIGLDFAFSLPAWALDALGCADAPALWARAGGDEGARWLDGPTYPFWGRRGVAKPAALPAEFRGTEREVRAATGHRPSSVFKLVGPDQVGAASVRGMPLLAALRDAGARIWPFDDPLPGVPVVVEIWPRAAYAEPVTKARPAARAAYLARHAPPSLAPAHHDAALASDDAFDALTAALALWDDRASLAALPRARSAEERREGRIWWPALPLEA